MSIMKAITHKEMAETVTAEPLSRAEFYASAERRMRRGKRLVICGFVVAVLGIVAYCAVGLSTGVNHQLGSAFLDNAQWLIGPTLGIIGLGTLLWLAGSFLYVSGGMDTDPESPDIYF